MTGCALLPLALPPLGVPSEALVDLPETVHIRGTTVWSGAHYRVHGDLILERGGTLVLDHATVELTCSYSREFNYRFAGGRLISRHSSLGGSKREGLIYQSNIELTDGEWDCTDTQVQYCYGITFGWGEQGGKLRATRLTGGENPDSIIMSGRGNAVVRDSDYMISLNAYADAGGTGVLDLPLNTPLTQVFDGSNVLGAKFRLQLINTKVPFWFVFANNVTMAGPPAELLLRHCPSVLPSILGYNLRGTVHLPSPWPGKATHAALTVGNLTWRTLDEPVGVHAWGLYLCGPETDLTVAGQTLICELMVVDGTCALIGDEGTYDAAMTATTLEAGMEGTPGHPQVLVRNASVGRFPPGGPIRGQVAAHDGAAVTIEHARCSDLCLLTKGSGTITLREVRKEGAFTPLQQGGPIVVE